MKKFVATLCLFSSLVFADTEEKIKDFTMDGEFGLIATTGNTKNSSLKAKLNSHQELEQWSNDYIAEIFYKQESVVVNAETGEEDDKASAQKLFISGQGNYKLENESHRLFVFSSYEDDRFSGFDYQATLAGGWSQELWKDDISAFNYSIGPGYSISELNDGETNNNLIVRAAADYNWKISETATFRQLLSTEVGSDNTKSKSESSLAAKINGSLAMKLSFIMNHNTDVEPGIKQLDTETAVTLVYTFF